MGTWCTLVHSLTSGPLHGMYQCNTHCASSNSGTCEKSGRPACCSSCCACCWPSSEVDREAKPTGRPRRAATLSSSNCDEPADDTLRQGMREAELVAWTGKPGSNSGGGQRRQWQLRPPAAPWHPCTELLQLLEQSPSNTAAAGSVVKRAEHRIARRRALDGSYVEQLMASNPQVNWRPMGNAWSKGWTAMALSRLMQACQPTLAALDAVYNFRKAAGSSDGSPQRVGLWLPPPRGSQRHRGRTP